jgi:hypothetical protein
MGGACAEKMRDFSCIQDYYNYGGAKIKVKEEKGLSPFSLTRM